MRLKALDQIEKNPQHDDYCFSVIFSTHPKVRSQIQSKFLEFLNEVQKLVGEHPEENVYQMNFDLLEWG